MPLVQGLWNHLFDSAVRRRTTASRLWAARWRGTLGWRHSRRQVPLRNRLPRRQRHRQLLPHNSIGADSLARADDKAPGVRKLLDNRQIEAEIIREQPPWIRCKPCRDRDLLIVGAVERDENFRLLVSDLADVMAEAPIDEGHVAWSELVLPILSVCSEDADLGPAPDVVLPFVGIGMPVQFAQSARFKRQNYSRYRRRYRKLLLGNEALGSAGKVHQRGRAKSKLMAHLTRRETWIHRRRRIGWRHLARDDVDFFFRQLRNRFGRQAQVLRQHLRRRMRKPVGNTERTELRESPVVEDEQKVTLLRTDTLNRVSVSLGEIPYVAGSEIRDLGIAGRSDDGYAATAADHVGPFGRNRVPVKLAQGAWLQTHRNGGKTLRNGKLIDRMLTGRAGRTAPSLRLLQCEFEVRKVAHDACDAAWIAALVCETPYLFNSKSSSAASITTFSPPLERCRFVRP